YSILDALIIVNVVFTSFLSIYYPVYLSFFSFSCDHRHLHSFPTRRSSDLRSITGFFKELLKFLLCCFQKRTIRPPETGDGFSAVDRKSTRLNSSHVSISYAVFCLKKKKNYMKYIVLTESH